MSNYKIDDDALKGGKRGKKPVEIYRPGSGPLPRKTGRGEDEMPEPTPQKDQRKFGGGEKPRGPGGGGGGVPPGGPSSRNRLEVSSIMDALLKVRVSRRNNDDNDGANTGTEDTTKKNRNRKTESQLHVVKHLQSQQNSESEHIQEKSVRNNNKVNNNKEGSNRAPSNTVERNQSVKSNINRGSNGSYSDRNHQVIVSDDENSNSQTMTSGRNSSDRSRKSKHDKRKRKGKAGGGPRNESNRQMNGFQDHQAEKTSQPSSRGQESAASDNSHTYSDSCSGSTRSLDKRNDYNKQISRDDNRNYEQVNSMISDRNIRQTSEPRAMPTGSHFQYDNCNNRSMRDTHSMEHNDSGWNTGGYADKGGNKMREHGRRPIGGKHNKTSHHAALYIPPVTYADRHNKTSHRAPVDIPPRFLKKKQMENNLKHIGTTNSDDQWDGSSIVFQGTNPMYPYANVPQHGGHAPPNHPPHMHAHHPSMYHRPLQLYHPHQPVATPAMPIWHNTLPGSRGRGRLPRPESINEIADLSRNTRSLTPERLETRQMYADAEETLQQQNHRYGFSSLQETYCREVAHDSQYNDNEVDNFYDAKANTPPPDQYQSVKDSSPTNIAAPSVNLQDETAASSKSASDPQTGEESESALSKNQTASTDRLTESTELNNDDVFKIPTSNSLDWVEEIERTERLQARSDLSRSTSVNSLHDTSPRRKESGGGFRRKREPKRRKRHGSRNEPNDRSPSRDSSRRRGSHESLEHSQSQSGTQWRRGEKENLSWRANSHERSNANASGSSRHNSAERWQHHKDQRNGGGNPEWFRGSQSSQKDRGRYRGGGGERDRDRRHRRGSSELWSTKSSEETNWRNELRPPPSKTNDNPPADLPNAAGGGDRSSSSSGQKSPGILVLPPSASASMSKPPSISPRGMKPGEQVEANEAQGHKAAAGNLQRQLFNPNNPNEPIIVASPGCRVAPPQTMAGPYDTGQYPVAHSDLDRYKLQEMQKVLLITRMNFCQEKNIEQSIWKIVFYNIIEFLRKMITDFPDTADRCKDMLLSIIEEGMKYYEDLLAMLEGFYKIKFDDYLDSNPDALKDLGMNKLTLVSAQKIFLCLGDLARYKDQVNEKEQTQRGGSNYGIARQWYMKAQQINPKNGRPYNQLAVVSFYGRRKLDAVYYYMRSLMASNPFQTARETLLSMFDENRKKWESGREKGGEREREKERAADKEGLSKGRTRREIWIRPDGGKRVLKTTSAYEARDRESEDEENLLKMMPYVDLNKRFGVSFLHVHGKLFTRIGMETFQEAGIAMLREFRVLLQHSPIPLTLNRFLQLLALNMFAIDNTQLKNADLEPGYRSATQECALIVSLQMFNLIVERCVELLLAMDSEADAAQHETPISNLTSDVHVLLPAIKVWCDWLLCHSTVWNPPPSCRDYRVGPSGDAWTRLAMLVNLLEKFNTYRDYLSTVKLPDSKLVRLPEDVTLSGFTPLMYNTQDPIYTNGNSDMDLAQISLRIHKIIFFGTEFLCGVDPPVLKLQKYETGVSKYISVVEIPSPPVQSDSEVCIEDEDDEEGEDEEEEGVEKEEESDKAVAEGEEGSEKDGETKLDISNLLQRKEQLERSHRKQERRRQKVQAILRECEVRVKMEVRPHYLVPDTNCLIDYMAELAIIANATSATNEHLYSLMVPIVVINELEGLSQGAGKGGRGVRVGASAQHTALLAEAARNALSFLRSDAHSHASIKCLTTHGNTLNSTRFTFTAEEEYSEDMKNDDKILTACLNLSRLNSKESKTQKEDGPRRVYCEVVLLTEDRNLKLKALARDMPVSDMPHFMRWAGLGLG